MISRRGSARGAFMSPNTILVYGARNDKTQSDFMQIVLIVSFIFFPNSPPQISSYFTIVSFIFGFFSFPPTSDIPSISISRHQTSESQHYRKTFPLHNFTSWIFLAIGLGAFHPISNTLCSILVLQTVTHTHAATQPQIQTMSFGKYIN